MDWYKRWRLERLIVDRAKALEKLEEAKRSLREGTVCTTLGREQVAERRKKWSDIETKIIGLQRELRHI